MHEAQAIIERIRRVTATLQRLDVAVEATQREIRPGQLFLARTTASFDPYLRQPWVPIAQQGGSLVIERPATQHYTPGQVVNLIGPVGRPIPLASGLRALLLIAYEASPAALLMLAHQALGQGSAVTLALVGRAGHYPLDVLPKEIEIVRAEDHEQWAERDRLLTWAEQVVAVAPPHFDFPAYARLCDTIREVRIKPAKGFVYGLFHGPMPCGVGACGACLVNLRGSQAAACVEGPAFDLLSVRLATGERA